MSVYLKEQKLNISLKQKHKTEIIPNSHFLFPNPKLIPKFRVRFRNIKPIYLFGTFLNL